MEWIRQALASPQLSLTALGAAAVLGMVMAVGSACNLPVALAVAGYAGSGEEKGRGGLRAAGAGFFLGIVASMTGLGLLIGSASRLLGSAQGSWARIAAGFVILLFGLWALGWLPFRLPAIAPRAAAGPAGMAGASLFGFAAGSVSALCALTCSAPLVPVLAALASVKGSPVWGGAVLMAVSIGYAAALTALMLGIRMGRAAAFMKKIETGVRVFSGLALLIAGFWLLAKG